MILYVVTIDNKTSPIEVPLLCICVMRIELRLKRVLLGGGREEGRHEVARSTTYKCVCARVFLVILTFEDFPPK